MLTRPARMLAARWHAAGDVRVEPVPVPDVPDPGMAHVAVLLCGICGTDVGEYRTGPFLIRTQPHPLSGQAAPVTLGHEFSGRIVAVSEGVDLEVGTRVTADACWRCGACAACKRGDYHVCRYGGSIGLVSDGALAPVVSVPAYTLVPLPPAVSDEAGALAEPLAVGLHAVDRGWARAGDDVLVLGFGPIGAAAALAARAIGCRALVVEAAEERAEVAEEMGFDVIEAGSELRRRVRTRLGRLGADVAVECTGRAAVLPEAIASTDRGGRVVAVGLDKTRAELDPAALVLYERSLVGSLGYRHDVPRVVDLVARGAIDPSPLIERTISLDQVPATLAELANRPPPRPKVLVSPT